MLNDGERREEILETAASLLASSGIRTSLKEIGEACGILPGSLYHHFESKDALIVELVQRYRDQLDEVAERATASLRDESLTVEQRVVELGEQIAACAVRNRAALLLTLYEPPATATAELVELAEQAPTAITDAMTRLLTSGQGTGDVRGDVDAPLLAERICQSMLHVGIGTFHRSQAAKRLPTLKCEVYLHGIAHRAPGDAALDRSAARRAADVAIATWSDGADEEDRAALLRSIARTEFGRRGYEATTMRDVARSAGLSTGTVYRTYRSKDELLVAIMETFSHTFAAAWDAVLTSSGSTIEQLDALLWVNIKLLERFSEEFRIQLAWLRQSPPDSVDLGALFGTYVNRLQKLIRAGEQDGSLVPRGASASIRARSLYEMLLTPEGVVLHAGPDASLALARGSVLRGALSRP